MVFKEQARRAVGAAGTCPVVSSDRRFALVLGGVALLVLNTAAILAMLAHYREDRDFMYGLDIKFSDEAKGRRG